MFSVKFWVASGLIPLVAVIRKLYTPTVPDAGVPPKTPVLVFPGLKNPEYLNGFTESELKKPAKRKEQDWVYLL